MKITLYGKDYEWDEEAISESHNISNRKICLSHDWINATLRFERKTSNGFMSVSIEERHDDEHFGRRWGGVGGIRFCQKCKLIDCIHFWKDTVEDNSWKLCEHDWSGGLIRSDDNNGAEWRCLKCGAVYRFTCGHGGSLYVCDSCFKWFITKAEEEAGSLYKYLSSRCWKPEVPVIKTCIHCYKRIKVYG